MSLTDLIPGKRDKQPNRHRADDRIARLEKHLAAVQADNAKLLNRQMAADDYFAILIDDRNQVYDAWRHEGRKRAEAEIAAGLMQSDRDQAIADREADAAELAELRVYKANAEAVTVPPMERDTTAIEDQATGPIDVRPLWEALGPVIRVSTSGASADPGQPRAASWGVDDTQPLGTTKGVT
ncbi:hypothetical protein [Streptomyces sp. MZ04]|uniref:hypothetical protein n=1 Tax=Streptomyces sp. MZ04 TaxID=2559236 RepID=UPI00107E924C|nr:hypothetical protein [Streptomyces sp. MZ04]TGB11588.1 hypothetical protein E2651_12985 [Streptomyces sp. MZ04]